MKATPTFPPYVYNNDDIIRGIKRISKALRKRDAQFLFGAGMSASVGVPTSGHLLDKVFDYFFTSNPPLGERREELKRGFPFETLIGGIFGEQGTDARGELTEILQKALLAGSYKDLVKTSKAHNHFLTILGGSKPDLLLRAFNGLTFYAAYWTCFPWK